MPRQALIENLAARMANGEQREELATELLADGMNSAQVEQLMAEVDEHIARGGPPSGERPGKGKDVLVGTLWLVGGLAVTGYSFFAAEPGGGYMLAWGPVVYGAYRVGKGILV